FGVAGWVLALLGRGILQLVSCRPAIPEVTSVEVSLASVVMQRRKVSCVNVTLWVALGNPVIRIGSVYCDGNRSWVRSAREYAQDRHAVSITCRRVVAVTAGEIPVHR